MKAATKRKVIAAAAVLAALVLAQQVFIGWRFAYGPFKALGQNRIQNLPGNSDEYSFAAIERVSGSMLEGKTVLFLGSSVTYGAGSLGEAVPEYFAARTGCEAIKEAVSSTTLAGTDDDTYVHRLINNVSPTAPVRLVVCQLSTNDATKKLPLGDITGGTGAGDFDTETITGALESIIAYCGETWNCPVVFYTSPYYKNERYGAMVSRLYELQGKWGIGILDLWNNESFNAVSDEQRALYMSDSIHPTRAGYRDWWGPELENQLNEFLINKLF